MPHYLKHHFDPDFDHTRLRPKEDGRGQVDHYNLGYVQNVIKDQVLVEILDMGEDESRTLDPRFILPEPKLPAGPKTYVNPEKPHQLLAGVNGYVLYEDGLIRVREVLNIRRSVDFHTGNVVFVGDVAVHGRVRSGFQVQGRNVLVKDNIQDATVTAQQNLKAEAGVLGGSSAQLKAGASIHAPFISNCQVLAGENLVVDGPLMHSVSYVRKQVSVKGRLQGGGVYSNGTVLVRDQIGGGGSTVTSVVLGMDPFLMLKAEILDEKIQETHMRLSRNKRMITQHPELEEECAGDMRRDTQVLEKLLARRHALDRQLAASNQPMRCSLLVPGLVKPGLEISIGSAYFAVDEAMENVRFSFKDDDIVIDSPALDQQ